MSRVSWKPSSLGSFNEACTLFSGSIWLCSADCLPTALDAAACRKVFFTRSTSETLAPLSVVAYPV